MGHEIQPRQLVALLRSWKLLTQIFQANGIEVVVTRAEIKFELIVFIWAIGY